MEKKWNFFKVSIDRLVKEEDICTVNLFCDPPYPKQDIRAFLIRAKTNTYAAGQNEISLSKPAAHDFQYAEGDYLYQCQIQGDFECFSGDEKIYCKQDKVYTCTFHGGAIL